MPIGTGEISFRSILSRADAQERWEDGWPTEHTDDTERMRGMRRVRVCFMVRAFSAFRGPLCVNLKALDHDAVLGAELGERAEIHAGDSFPLWVPQQWTR